MFEIIGTVAEYEKVKNKLPEVKIVRVKICAIVTLLDDLYGADRNVLEADGGFCLFTDTNEGMTELQKVIDITRRLPESVQTLGAEYLNALYLRHNEFGINLIIPKDIAPKNILDELE